MSRVIVTIGGKKDGKKRRKTNRRRHGKPSKTWLEKIYHNLKRFANVTLSTKKRKEEAQYSKSPKAFRDITTIASDNDITTIAIDNDITVGNKTMESNTEQTRTFGSDISFGENFIDLRHSVGENNSAQDTTTTQIDYYQDILAHGRESNHRISEQVEGFGSRGRGRSLPLEVLEEEQRDLINKDIEFEEHRIGEVREINFVDDWTWRENKQTHKKAAITREKGSEFQILEFTNLLIIAAGVSIFFIFSAGIVLQHILAVGTVVQYILLRTVQSN